MKPLKTLIIFALVLISLTNVFGQTAAERFNQAKEASENSQFEKTLTLLDAIEKDFGKSPRVESLRALTLRDLNRPRDAYLSVLAYFKLTEGMNLSSNAAHKSLIELRDTLKSQLETDLSAKKDNLQAERDKNAEKAISETDTISKSNTTSSNATNDPLAELEMWNKVKTSTNANDYYLFLMRFPGGSFAKLANAKMNEIGDPVWNEVKRSKDPFVYRDYISKNPNSPFILEAKDKMNMLAASAIAWEQIKNSNEISILRNYISKYPSGTYTEEAKEKIKTLSEQSLKTFKNYFPTTISLGADGKGGSDIKFIDKCNLESLSYFYSEKTSYPFTIASTINLGKVEGVRISKMELTNMPIFWSVSIASNGERIFSIRKVVYKNSKLKEIRSDDTKNSWAANLGDFQDGETASRFVADLSLLVKSCGGQTEPY